MQNWREYGIPPYRVAVLHGGPGAQGEMAPVARELSRMRGIVEPMQMEKTVDGQIGELVALLRKRAELPAVVAGYSWGAWLGYMTAAHAPDVVSRLIMVSAGAFEACWAEKLMDVRLRRLGPGQRERAREIMAAIDDSCSHIDPREEDEMLAEFGRLMAVADSYELLPGISCGVRCKMDIYRSVWPQAAQMRKTGELLDLGHKIRCPVTAIHGAYDPTPAEGVRKPLESVLDDFNFILLQRCGHTPWKERHARSEFYRLLSSEIGDHC